MRRTIILLIALSLAAPLMFYGCSGDDGAAGPAGAAGAPGGTGGTGGAGGPGTGVVAAETCVVCHGAGETFNPAAMHRLNADGTYKTSGTATITINNVTFGAPAGDNVPVTVNFTFAARNSDNVDITSQIDLTTRTGNPPGASDNLAFLGFAIAKLVAAAPGSGDTNVWNGFIVNPTGTGSAPYRTNRPNGVDGAVLTGTPATGVYSYTFPTSAVRVSDGYVDNVVMRVGIQFTSSPSAATPALQATLDLFTTDPILQQSRNRPVANGVLDVVNPVGGGLGTAPTGAYPTKDVVTTAACNGCHDPLNIHGGGRREYKLCQICHNAKTEIAGNTQAGGPGWDNTNLVKLVHGIHRSYNLGTTGGNPAGAGNFTEVTYPQDIRNCATCHKGPDGANWKNKPTITACGSCHTNVNFATGAGHLAGAQSSNATCALCHNAQSITLYHATENSTPNNPVDRPGLVSFQYGIDTVTVDNTNKPVVKFWIKSAVAGADGTLGAFSNLNLGASGDNATRPSGFTGSPSFLVAYGDNAATVADYSNYGKSAAQPASVTLIGLPITGTPAQYTVTLTSAFPAGAKMRAVALQGYFTQTNVDTTIPPDGVNDNVGRHTPAVQKAVTGDAVRRVLVKSGYDNVAGVLTPVGCLECHEVFEGHGGNRVNNVQVCVMCHNPNLTSSARTIPDNVTIAPAIVAKYGSNPLTYPEVAQNMKELIHGIHASTMRGANSFEIIRNRQETPGVYGVYIHGAEITYPGNPMHCTKCHVSSSTAYDGTLVAGTLYTTEKVTTGNSAETLAEITAARGTVPNSTDLVNSPIASACGYCHNTSPDLSHILLNGGDIKSTRATANIAPPTLMPDVLATP